MRKDRIKFKEIDELTEYIQLLYAERDLSLNTIEDINKKIINKEYDKNSDIFNPITKDLLLEDQKQLKISITDIATDLENIKSKLHTLNLEKKDIKFKYKNQALSLRYKSNKTKYQNVNVGELTLNKKVIDIRYYNNYIKDSLSLYIEFEDGSIYTASVGLQKDLTITKKL